MAAAGRRSCLRAGEHGEQFGGFKRLDDERIRAHAPRFFLLERLQFTYGQQDGNPPSLAGFLYALANLQAAVAWHIDVEHDQVRLVFSDFLEGRRAVIDGDALRSRRR